MANTYIASPPQNHIEKSECQIKNIKKKVKFLTIYLFISLLKNPGAVSYQTRQWRKKWENGDNLIRIQPSEGHDSHQYFFFLFLRPFISGLFISSYTESYSQFIGCICSVFVFSKLALNGFLVVILSATLPSKKQF